MADLLNIGRSGLQAFQKALGTIGHNIANANTPGYSRQSVSLSSLSPEFSGAGFLGRGVNVGSVRRSYDSFVLEQLRTSQSAFNHQQTLLERSGQVDRLLGEPATSLAAGLQGFFDSVQVVSDDPTSTTARQVMLTEGQTLVSRFRQLSQSLDDQRSTVNTQIRSTVEEINTLAASVADVNRDIVTALGQSGGDPPNDLLDRRDVLIEELSQRLSVSTAMQQDGALNVFIGTGQNLVLGAQASTLTTVALGSDSSELDVALVAPGTTIPITDFISGGKLGGLYDFTGRVLEPAKNNLGLIAIGMASTFNDQHNLGMDLDGAMGQNFFAVPTVEVHADAGNAGPGPVSVAYDDVSQLTADEYELSFDGLAWSLRRASDGQAVPLSTGSGTAGDPFLVNGLSIVTDPAAVNGDSYEIRPTRNGADQIDVALTDNRKIAAAALHLTEAAAGNAGDATISPTQVLDSSDPNLLNPVSIVFDATAANFSVNGGAPIAYSSGANIDVNGFRVQISGTPQPGDTFAVNPNFGGVGDNGNALQLADMQQSLTLFGGTASFNDSYSALVADVATKTRQAEIGSTAQQHLLEQSQLARETVSGVNLDEEAADLLRFEQAYQAAARVIAVADSLFDELINAVRG